LKLSAQLLFFYANQDVYLTNIYKSGDTEASKTEFSRSPDILADRPKVPACKLKAATGDRPIRRSSDRPKRGLNACLIAEVGFNRLRGRSPARSILFFFSPLERGLSLSRQGLKTPLRTIGLSDDRTVGLRDDRVNPIVPLAMI
jgi:hypothetical protein